MLLDVFFDIFGRAAAGLVGKPNIGENPDRRDEEGDSDDSDNRKSDLIPINCAGTH